QKRQRTVGDPAGLQRLFSPDDLFGQGRQTVRRGSGRRGHSHRRRRRQQQRVAGRVRAALTCFFGTSFVAAEPVLFHAVDQRAAADIEISRGLCLVAVEFVEGSNQQLP